MSSIRPALAALACFVAVIASSTAPARGDAVGVVRRTLTRGERTPGAGVTVTLAGDRTTQSAVTGRDGRFAFARVPFGHYTLRVAAADGPVVATVDVATDAIVAVALVSAT